MKANPIMQVATTEEGRKQKRLGKYSGASITFGGHLPPVLVVPYQVTVKDKTDQYHAISMMKVSLIIYTQSQKKCQAWKCTVESCVSFAEKCR